MNQKRRVKELIPSNFLVSLEKEDIIARGGEGIVVRAFDKSDMSRKLVAKVATTRRTLEPKIIRQKLLVLEKVPVHQNIVHHLGNYVSKTNNFYIIMEECEGGTLSSLMNQKLSQRRIQDFLFQFCRGYKVLLSKQIIHGDIKPENILISEGKYKIADFGISMLRNQSPQKTIRGTVFFMAPEIYKEKNITHASDMYSLGVVLYMLIYQRHFIDSSETLSVQSFFLALNKTQIDFSKSNGRSKQLISLCQAMLESEPQRRLKWQQLFGNGYVQQGRGLQLLKTELPKHFRGYENQSMIIENQSKVIAQNVEPKLSRVSLDSALSYIIHDRERLILFDNTFRKTYALYHTSIYVDVVIPLIQLGIIHMHWLCINLITKTQDPKIRLLLEQDLKYIEQFYRLFPKRELKEKMGDNVQTALGQSLFQLISDFQQIKKLKVDSQRAIKQNFLNILKCFYQVKIEGRGKEASSPSPLLSEPQLEHQIRKQLLRLGFVHMHVY